MANKDKEIQQLAEEIWSNVDGRSVKTELSTNQRIIARVTDGIYREPWAAFRELVANAYDADATSVVIETKAPLFDQIVVRDNGNGMSPDVVARLVRSIGGSSKRTEQGQKIGTTSAESPELSVYFKRPLIGKIGIGIFAVAQLTQHFQIITKTRGEKIRTSVTIKLTTHDEHRMRDADEDFVAGTVEILSVSVAPDDVETHGTSIILYNLRPEILNTLRSEDRWVLSNEVGEDGKPLGDKPTYHVGRQENAKRSLSALEANLPWEALDPPGIKFEKLFEAAKTAPERQNKTTTLEHFDEYLRLIWKLSLALPLDYIKNHPFDLTGDCGINFVGFPFKRSLPELNLQSDESPRARFGLKSGVKENGDSFEILIDGISLRRPIKLETSLLRPSRLPHPIMMVGKVEKAYDDKVLELAGGQLSFEAYMYWNSKITPKDVSGTLIRVRDASGSLFDENFLRYQVSEQNRLRQLIVEVFVTEGLDGAINIDRESFNFSHPHFIFIQKWLHVSLRLFINRLKGIARHDLVEERERVTLAAQEHSMSQALDIWRERQGTYADEPLMMPVSRPQFELVKTDVAVAQYLALPTEVGGTELDWRDVAGASDLDPSKVAALAVILEAYGAFGTLRSNERATLIRDIVMVVANA